VRGVASGANLYDVVAQDLAHFVKLQYLDLGDNSIPLNRLERLPALKELHLHCNGISTCQLSSEQPFPALQVLGLGYNGLPSDSLIELGKIKTLLELDLTCNELASIPDDWSSFKMLQKLSLRRNRLTNNKIIETLSKLPR
jgi:Leucine-rich repeat (LRR) protein